MSVAAAHTQSAALHASAVLIAERAVIIRGASGSGKSALALALIAEAAHRGIFARLVGDDRIVIDALSDRLVIASHPKIAGRIERRFVGLQRLEYAPEAIAGLVVDLLPADDDRLARLPDEHAAWAIIDGVRLPRLALPAGHSGAEETILARLSQP